LVGKKQRIDFSEIFDYLESVQSSLESKFGKMGGKIPIVSALDK
jgi:hypothetical protein